MNRLKELYAAIEDWCWNHRILATAPVVLLLLALARPTPASIGWGALIVALGEAGRFWASGYLTKNEQLTTAGPYRFTRNPLYFFNLVIFAGYCVIAANPWAAALGALAFFVIYRPCVRNEAERMRALFGEAYEAWAREVPLFWPRPTRWRGDGDWRWARVRQHREVRNALAMLGGVLLFAAIGWWRQG